MTTTLHAPNGNAIDLADEAHKRLISRGAVLDRLFELIAADHSDGPRRVDFGGHREHAFWEGLRGLTADMLDDAETVKAALDAALERRS